jgi:hypothetical protein
MIGVALTAKRVATLTNEPLFFSPSLQLPFRCRGGAASPNRLRRKRSIRFSVPSISWLMSVLV